MKVKIKICGITRKEDALLAAELGAWATGFIFVKNTPRYISPENAAEIIKYVDLCHCERSREPNFLTECQKIRGTVHQPPDKWIASSQVPRNDGFIQHNNNIEKIGVFADESLEEIKNIADKTKITKIQLHGKESPEFCEESANLTGKKIIKAIRVKDFEDLEIISQYKNKVSFILLDSFSENESGGTGKIFDWKIAKKAEEYDIPLILAGGLNPDNIKQACKSVKPYALDISSGVEAQKGIKDSEKLIKLFNCFTSSLQ